MTEIIESKPPIRSGYKETIVTWINPKCQAMSNYDIPITDGIDKALKLIGDRCYMQRLENIMDGYIKRGGILNDGKRIPAKTITPL